MAEAKDDSAQHPLTRAGAAYFFERDSIGIWTQIQKVVASDRAEDDHFAKAVALDLPFAIVGAFDEDHDVMGGNTMNGSGAAYLFKKDSIGTWMEIQKIVPTDRQAGDRFGWSVAIHEEIAFVGADEEDEDALGGNTLQSAGSAFVFQKDSNDVWNQVQKLVASDRVDVDMFGTAVAISGGSAMIGANGVDQLTTTGYPWDVSGAAYFFSRPDTGLVGDTMIIDTMMTSIGDLQPESNFRIIPNPNEGKFVLTFNQGQLSGQVIVKNALGQRVLIKEFKETNELFLDMDRGPSGVYWLIIDTNEGVSVSKRVIKKERS